MIQKLALDPLPGHIRMEFQYFDTCPHHETLWKRIEEAVRLFGRKVQLSRTHVTTPEQAVQKGFRGSPTLLINGEDLEGLPAPQYPRLACRLYLGGLPTVEQIKAKLETLP